jgi:hypothetical protein
MHTTLARSARIRCRPSNHISVARHDAAAAATSRSYAPQLRYAADICSRKWRLCRPSRRGSGDVMVTLVGLVAQQQ